MVCLDAWERNPEIMSISQDINIISVEVRELPRCSHRWFLLFLAGREIRDIPGKSAVHTVHSIVNGATKKNEIEGCSAKISRRTRLCPVVRLHFVFLYRT